MKKIALLVAALLATLLSTSSCVSTRTRMLSQDDMKNVKVIGTVEAEFNRWLWLHAFYSKEDVGDKAYVVLKKAAEKKYQTIGVDVVNIDASGKLSMLSFSQPLGLLLASALMGNGGPFILGVPIGNLQRVVATGDVISADRTRAVSEQRNPLDGTVVPLSESSETSSCPQGMLGLEEAIGKACQKLMGKIVDGSRIAVVSIAYEDAGVAAMISDEIQYHLLSANRFTVVDRNTLDVIRDEQNFQMSGAVDDKEVLGIGKFSGANVVITGYVAKTEDPNINRLYLKTLNVELARLIEIAKGGYCVGKLSEHTAYAPRTAPIQATTPDPMKEPEDWLRILDKRIKIELGGHVAWSSMDYSGFPESSTGVVHDANARFDLVYVDIDLAIYNLVFGNQGGVLTQNNHLLLKYPIVLRPVKISPLLGASYTLLQTITERRVVASQSQDWWFPLGVRADLGMSKAAYLSTEFLYGFGTEGGSNVQSFKLGCGFNLGRGKRFYWRPELLYHFTRMDYNEKKIPKTIPPGFYLVPPTQEYEESARILKHTLGLNLSIGWKLGAPKYSPKPTNPTAAAMPVTQVPPPVYTPPPPPQQTPSMTPTGEWKGNWTSDEW